MHDQGISDPERDDLRTQAGLMTLVLSDHPAALTVRDVVMEMDCDTPEEAVLRAIRDLTVVGLLRREGDSILATRAAYAFDRLPL